jgi:hydrogenase maturation protease
MKEATILIGGIGNIFHGDDAFGVEVINRLLNDPFFDQVRVVDFGIRGYDFAFALLEGYETAIMVDAVQRGGAPGTIYLIEIGAEHLNGTDAPADAHSMNPLRVLQLARQVGGPIGRVLLLGCEPETFGPEDEGAMGLSEAVQAAIEPAAERIRRLVAGILAGEAPANEQFGKFEPERNGIWN